MIDRVRDGRHAGDQAGKGDARQVEQRDAPPSLARDPAQHRLAQAFVCGEQGDHGREGELEARPGDALGLDGEDGDRGPAQHAHRDRGAVEQYAKQHHAGHDEGALGRHRSTRNEQIEGGPGECREGRPLLDRITQREGRNERQERAHAEEKRARHHAEVKAGDGKEMGQPRIPHGLDHIGRNGAPLAGHESGGDAAFRTRQLGRHALGDAIAQCRERERKAARPLRLDGDAAIGVAHGAEPEIIGMTLKIEGTGCYRRRRWKQHRAQAHLIAGTELRGRIPQAHADASRRALRRQALHQRPVESDAPASGKLLDFDDAAAQRYGAEPLLQPGCLHLVRAPARDGKAECDRGECKQERERVRTPAAEAGCGEKCQRRRGCRPVARLEGQGKIKGDARAKEGRQPERPALALRLELALGDLRRAPDNPSVHLGAHGFRRLAEICAAHG